MLCVAMFLSVLIGSVRIRILGRNSAGRLQKSIEWLQSWQLGAAPAECLNDFFRWDISNQSILCEWASAESAECRVEAAATGVICGQHLLSSLIRAAVQMNSDVKVVVLVEHRADQVSDLLWRRETNSIRQ